MREGLSMDEKSKEEELRDIDVEKYAKDYSEEGLWTKIKDNVSSIGLKLIYKALQLFYVAQSPNCPMKVKAGIYAALGYLIDATAIGIALVLAQVYITDEIKAQARGKIHDLFGMKALAKLDEGEGNKE